jgi:phosphatidylglycerol:prolipoprotein diacylglycerol transferase
LVLIALVAGILGARLGYALRFVDVYLREPAGLFSLNPSTLAPTEGLVVGLIAALIYAQRKKLPLWSTLDAYTPGLALFAVFVGLAHLSSGDAFGAETSLPWAIELWGANRHPSQVYEILGGLLVFFTLIRLRHMAPFNGFLFLVFAAFSAGTRLFLEAFRGDSVIVFGVLRSAQIASLLVLLTSLVLLHLRARRASEIVEQS